MSKKISFFFAAVLMFQAHLSFADVVIIGNAELNISSLTAKQVKQLYLGKSFSIDGTVVSLADCKPLQKEFLDKYIKKSVKSYNKSWLKKVFGEGATAPVIFKTSDEVINFVRTTPKTIGYVSAAPEDGRVKVLLK